MRVGLVGCVKSKLTQSAPARELYTSALFAGRRAYVEATCDQWFILSAKHGLVEPGEILAPYDETLKGATRDERRKWSGPVLEALEQRLGALARITFEFHAGADYRAYGLVDGLVQRGALIENPTAGLGMGHQLAFYDGAARRRGRR